MRKKILVPLDGSSTSESVLPHVARLAGSEDVALHLVTVCVRSNRFETVSQAYLNHLKNKLTDEFGDVEATVLTGRTDSKILDFAAEKGVDLIAMTTHGRSGLKRIVYGSTAEKILRTSPVPLYLALPHVKPRKVRSILVPLDGSHRAETILPLVSDLAKGSGAKVTLLAISPVALPAWTASSNLVEAQDRLRKLGLRTDLVIQRGNPADVILKISKSVRADLIAFSTHGRSGLERARFGSVAEAVLHRSTVPMILKRTACVPRRHRFLYPKRQRGYRRAVAQETR